MAITPLSPDLPRYQESLKMQKFDLKRVSLLLVALGLGVTGVLFYFPDRAPDATLPDASIAAMQSASDPGSDNQNRSPPITDVDAFSQAQSVTPRPAPPAGFADIAIDENGFGADAPEHIGLWLDADDPDAFDPDSQFVEPMHIGPPLDADDFSTVTASTTPGPRRNIGPVLDADNPFDQIDDDVDEPAVDVGPPLDADDPDSIDEAALGLSAPFPLEIGEPLDADAGHF